MKRASNATASEDDLKPSKQCKLETDVESAYNFDDPTFQIAVAKITDDVDASRWFSALCKMKWAHSNRPSGNRRFQLQTEDSMKFDVLLCGPEAIAKDFKPDIVIGDTVQFSLKNVKLRNKSASGYLPFTLAYESGVAFRIISSSLNTGNAGAIFDAWKLREEAQSRENTAQEDWFATPAPSRPPPNEEPAEEVVSSERHTPFTSNSRTEPNRTNSSTPRTPPPGVGDATEPHTALDVHITPVVKLPQEESSSATAEAANETETKDDGRKRRIKKRDTRHSNQQAQKKSTNAVKANKSNGMSIPHNTRDSVQHEHKHTNRVGKKKRDEEYDGHVPSHQQSRQLSPVRPVRNPALDLKAGLHCESSAGTYTALDQLKMHSVVSLLGIVYSTSGIKGTTKGDKLVTLSIVDPSRFSTGFSVNIFADPKFSEWLPVPLPGHVIILRGVKISSFKDDKDRMNGVVYKDRISWAAFNPTTGRFYHNDLSDAPPPSNWGLYGNAMMPFYQPVDDKEIEYCTSMGEWWRAIREQEDATRVQVTPNKKPRVHSLIGDMEVNVFFDATVEVVQVGEVEESGQRLILISDYTKHEQLNQAGRLGPFGHTTFSSRIPDDVVDDVKDGTLWSLRNLRLKINSNGYVELDLFAAKWSRLEDDLEGHLLLDDLFSRKKAFLASPFNPDNIASACGSEVSLVSQLAPNTFANITIEMLFVSHDRPKCTHIYVTDYTTCDQGTTYRPPQMFNDAPQVPFFKIAVWEDPNSECDSSFLRDLTVNSMYKLINVRIVQDDRGNVQGSLNHAQQTIWKVTQKGSTADDVVALRQRKCQYYGTEDVTSIDVIETTDAAASTHDHKVQPIDINAFPPGSFVLRSRHIDQNQNTIKQIKGIRKCPNKFRLIARVVDYFPLNFTQFAWRRCPECRKSFHEKLLACPDCSNMERKCVEWTYRFFLRLEDANGDRLDVAVCDEGANFLNGLPATNFAEDAEALKQLKMRFQNLIGNADEVHEGIRMGEAVGPVYGPFVDLSIKSWHAGVREQQKVVYALTGCTIQKIESKRAYVK